MCRKVILKSRDIGILFYGKKNMIIKLVNFKKNLNVKNIKDNSFMYKYSLFCVVYIKIKYIYLRIKFK